MLLLTYLCVYITSLLKKPYKKTQNTQNERINRSTKQTFTAV